jgi:hypothetical protein
MVMETVQAGGTGIGREVTEEKLVGLKARDQEVLGERDLLALGMIPIHNLS